MPTTDAVLEVDGVVTRFGTQTIHNGVSFTLQRGQLVAMIGGSGTGKSVLLREIVGLDQATDGKITFPEAEAEDRRPTMGVMFQDGALFSNLTVLENVEAPLREHTQMSRALREEIAGLKLAMAGLGPDSHHKKPAQISGGMRKRAAVARAIALDPELLFLDEPTAGLDPIAAENFDRMTEELARSLGLTVFLVTHDLDTLHAICDRVAVLFKGKVAAIGTIPEITANAEGWVKEYFSGPRGRAAIRGATGG